MVFGDSSGHVNPIIGGRIDLTAKCAKIAGLVAAEAIESNYTSSKFLKRYENTWKVEIGEHLKRSLKYRKVFDKLNDKELNLLAKFMKGRDLDNVTPRSLLVLLKKSLSLFRLLKEVINNNIFIERDITIIFYLISICQIIISIMICKIGIICQ